MAAKPPRVGSTNVDIHPGRPLEVDSSRPDVVGKRGIDPWISDVNPMARAKPSGNPDLDAILPAQTITVSLVPDATEVRAVMPPTLENYRITVAPPLPAADSEGFRVYNQRRYVDLTGGGIALVAVDQNTGLYRARRSSELNPSGPVLLRSPDTGLWHPHNDIAPATAPLTETRLQAFRTELDFSAVEPGSDGLYRHDGKLYAVIFNHAYQALHDLDASTPTHKVWRIVNPKDPVASDIANVYRASRSGDSLAITRNEENAWISIFVGLRGGMNRNEPAPAGLFRPWLSNTAGPSGRPPPAVATRAQVKRYFPEATDQHADDFIARFGDAAAAEVELDRLRLGLPKLNQELSVWEGFYRGDDIDERARRLAICDTLQRLYKWQGDPSERVYRDGHLVGFRLELDSGYRVNLEPPIISTRIDSIVSLSLRGNAFQKLDDLFSTFSHIETLEVRNLHGTGKKLLVAMKKLTELRVLEIHHTHIRPQPFSIYASFSDWPRLRELTLENCNIFQSISVQHLTELQVLRIRHTSLQFSPPDLAAAQGPSRLQVLDLSNNADLVTAPDLANLPFLRELNLSGTGLTRLPPTIGMHNWPQRLEILKLAGIPLEDAPSLRGMTTLRELDLSNTGITQLPDGIGPENGPLLLEVLNLSANPLFVSPSLRGMTALREVDLSSTLINNFPEGVTLEIPKTSLNLADNNISVIPESLELRTGFDLTGNPISNPAFLRRLIAARRQTGTDIWLGQLDPDTSANLWLHNVPEADAREKRELWDRSKERQSSHVSMAIRRLSMTPEFRFERQQLQHRLWAFLKTYENADPIERSQLISILENERSPGQMLDRLEEVMKKFDPTWQNQPPHHLPKPRGFD
ncbi:leucine-rich repeat domain-containing protein [Pseudomonas fluorescens]|uniref:leucine-rich repeat domain-containing protein n=1 Tax=Pseudomonas fluorescens TaxID=294 RepID=UPI00123F1552|nr:leucine-rich repeat domain-containing protein [Pseudomonas fluorescens]VVO79851.1 hypothetical protein PS898_01757 [Pseudomonas fluorescens]